MDREEVAKISKALSDPTRLSIYEKIASQPDATCGVLVEEFSLSPATVSHHLRVLTQANLIGTRRDGQFVHSCAVLSTLKDYVRALAGIAMRPRNGRKR